MEHKRIMLIGRTGAGKTTFCQALRGQELFYQKTQSIQILDHAIDTPGEYVENRALYRALLVTSADADLMVLVQDCTDQQMTFAPGFASMFGKPAIGLVTKTDLTAAPEMIQEAHQRLELAGCQRIFSISNTNGDGLEAVRQYLQSC